MNTIHKYDNGVPSYGLNILNQKSLLNKMNSFIFSIRVYGKKTLLPFQEGSLKIEYSSKLKLVNYFVLLSLLFMF